MKLLLASILALALAGPTYARLGETEGQSQTRYGQPREDLLGPQDKPLLAGSVEKQYLYEGFRVRAAFAEGRCLVIEYVHLPENNLPKEITPTEVQAILAAESGLDSSKLTNVPKEKQLETQSRRWKEEKVKAPPGLDDLAKGLKGALKLNKWTRGDGAVAEYALGLVLKITDRNADDWAKKYARDNKKPATTTTPGAKPPVPKF